MDLRALGSTGIRVSPLGLGTVKFGRNQQVRYPRPFDLPSDREIGVMYTHAAPAASASLLAMALNSSISSATCLSTAIWLWPTNTSSTAGASALGRCSRRRTP